MPPAPDGPVSENEDVTMPPAISTIRNLGPASEQAFARAGVHSAEDLHALGADAAYARLLENGERPHFISYYVLVMALQGRPWNDCQGAEKDALRERFDRIKTTAQAARQDAGQDKGRSRLEAALDEIGVIERPQPTSSRPEKK